MRRAGAGAVVIESISDGWDRGDLDLLCREAARLHRSTHRLIWLNPLLGAADYQPLALGIRVVLPTSTTSCLSTTWPASNRWP
jgi:uncharacterized protein with von Willebrand factor type A (vWA) domain